MRRAESKRAYTQGQQPKPSYTDGRGKSQPIDPRDRTIDDLRRKLDAERWQNREWRKQRDFGPYTGLPGGSYHDPFSTWFWLWLMAQNLDVQSRWMYHHRHEMDEARYRDAIQKNKELQERIEKLERDGEKRDPGYTPPGVDTDLMYSDEYAEAAYNPQGIALDELILGAFRFLVRSALFLGITFFLIWFVFFKRWGATTPRKV
jgi:hypothetical protein